jgi:uncharacterized protein with FMN-binding domain
VRRTVLTLLATVVGLVVLLGFKTSPTSAPTAAASAPTVPGSGSSISSSGSSSSGSSSSGSSSSSSGGSSSSGTVTGSAVQTRYGVVQVKVTVASGRITDVTAVQLPTDHPRDVEISNYAVPILRNEAIAAQSANINTVSGATYTSDGYTQSLQSALDQL